MDWTLVGAQALGGSIFCLMAIYFWHRLQNKKIDFKSYKFYLALLFAVICGMLINLFVPQYLKIFCLIFMFSTINYVFFCRTLNICLITVIINELFVMISETIFIVIIALFYSNVENLNTIPLGIILVNISISIMNLIFLRTVLPYKVYNGMIKLMEEIRNRRLVLVIILTVVLASLLMVMSWIKLPSSIVLLVNTILIVIYTIVIVFLVYTHERFTKIGNKYATSLSSLREHETMMDKYRVANHENKNQLLIIRNMIKSKDKTTINYIDKLIDNKSKENEGIFKKTEKIPEGGLRSIIYSKLCKMKEMKIKYALEISRDVKTSDLINLDDGTMLNICKIMGVFLDNSIEEVEKLKKQIITVELYNMDGYLCIDISNNYSGNLAIDKIVNKGYTTKGKGHGYGLSLVDEIIRSDSSLENEKEICRDMFTQRLKIKM